MVLRITNSGIGHFLEIKQNKMQKQKVSRARVGEWSGLFNIRSKMSSTKQKMSIKAKTSSTKRKTSPSILDNANKNTEGDGEDQATTIKRLKMENNSLKEKLKGYSDAEENAVKHKQSYQCCKHIDSSCSTKLQPNDSNMDDPSQYNAYSDKCKQSEMKMRNDAKQVERVHYSQGDEHHLEWQCNCYQPCCKYLKDDLKFTMLCEECEEEKLHPKPAWMSECYGCDRKQSVCGDLDDEYSPQLYCQRCCKDNLGEDSSMCP